MTTSKIVYPILVLCGRDSVRRELLQVLDPDGKFASKALIPMHGKRVLDWQLEALCDSDYVGDIYLIGLSREEYPCEEKITYIPVELTSTILEKITIGSEFIKKNFPDLEHVIVSTGDAPAMSTASVDLFFQDLSQNLDVDVLISGVPEDITKEIFPEHGRVVGRFKDQDVYPGEMIAFRYKMISKLKDEIDQLTIRRRQFNRREDTSKLGPIMRYLAKRPRLWMLIIKYLSGNLTVDELEKTMSRVYGMKMKTVIIPDPGFGMDMDLPEDYEKLSDYVEKTKILQIQT
jgi:NDP-sugar pyrophosphorylase family protein